MISEHDFSSAWRILALPTALAFFLVFWLNRNFEDIQAWQAWSIQVALFCFLAFWGIQKFSGDVSRAMLTNALAGFVLAFALAVTELVSDFSFPDIFTLVTEPAYAVLAAIGIAWITHSFLGRLASQGTLLLWGRKMLRWKG